MPSTMHMTGWRRAGALWILLIPLCSAAGTSDLWIHTSQGIHGLRVTTATSEYEQLTGLHGWESLAADEGMLFIFPGLTQRPFWMKHVNIALDILFIDPGGRIVDIIRHAEPGTETPLVADSPYSAALEINAGAATRMTIIRGDQVYHPLIRSHR